MGLEKDAVIGIMQVVAGSAASRARRGGDAAFVKGFGVGQQRETQRTRQTTQNRLQQKIAFEQTQSRQES
jgi:hypothetical protein